ncbi:MAG: hypothetical protein ACRYGG_05060 [Janthinobacterium lividum]
MSSLQDFAQQFKLTPPGDLGAPPAQPVAPVPQDVPQAAAPAPAPAPAPTDVPMVPVTPVSPTPAEINAGANAMEPPTSSLHGPRNILRAEERDERQARIDTDRAYTEQTQAAQEKAKLEGDQAAATQPFLNQHTRDIVENQQAIQKEYDTMHAVGQKASADYAAQIQSLSDKMANQPKDMFGRAGVNKVEGIIGLILGGLGGSANGGKNAGVERLNQLTNQKLAQDKYEYEMLGKKADMSQNLYAQLRNSGMDSIAAHNAYATAQTDALLSRIKATDNSFVPSKAKNDMQNTIAQLDQQRTQYLQQGAQHRYGQAMQAYGLEQKDRELQQRYDMFMAKLSGTPQQEGNPIQDDVTFKDPHFGKNNKSVMGRMQVQDQALKEAYAQIQQYHATDNWSFLKRAGLRKGVAGSLATEDVGNARVSEARVKAAETETGADPALHFGPIEIGQKGMFSNGIDDRLDQAFRTRAEVYYKSLKAAGGLPNPGSELDKIFKAAKVGEEYGLAESPGSIKEKEKTTKEAALDTLKKLDKNRPQAAGPAKGYVYN